MTGKELPHAGGLAAGYVFGSVATLGQNLQRLRKRAGFKTARSFAEAIGIVPSVISKLENDLQGLPEGPTLLRLAKVLKCSVDELLEGVDPDYQAMLQARAKEPPRGEAEPLDEDVTQYEQDDIPIIQEGDASPNGFVYDGEPLSADRAARTSRPYDYREKGAYAVVLRGDSMEPTLKRGMRLIVSQIQKVLDGDLVYVQLKSGERLAKIATRQSEGWLLTSANPAYGPRFVKFDDIAHIHKVAYVRLLK